MSPILCYGAFHADDRDPELHEQPLAADSRMRSSFSRLTRYVVDRSRSLCDPSEVSVPMTKKLNGIAAISLTRILFVMAIGWCVWPGASGSAEVAPPRGVYVYSYPRFVENGDYERAMAVAGVDGAAVVMRWAEIEPKKDIFDFTEFDRRVALARSHGLAIELVILAGGGAPDWLYAPPPAGVGLRRLNFVFSHHNGEGKTVPVTMPAPWDAAYVSTFGSMLSRVADHLRETGALPYVSVAKLTGINTDTDEIRLPNETPESTGNRSVTNAVSTWRSAGYRPALVVEAVRGVAAAWARAFPGVWKVLPIIPLNSFPPIGERGQVVDGQQAQLVVRRLLDELVSAAESANRGRFILQMDWLNADQPVRSRVMQIAGKLGVPVAWQTNFYLGREGKGAGCGGEFGATSHCDNASFLRLLKAGIAPKGGRGANARGLFIEVFPPDVIEYASVVLQAHQDLVK